MDDVVVTLDGAQVAPGDARVSVFDRGFLYGDGVFEVLRTYRREVFALEEHLVRLQASARRIGLPMPVAPARLRAEVEATVRACEGERHVRLIVTRGRGDVGLAPARVTSPLRAVIASPLCTPPREHYAAGIRATTLAVPWLSSATPLAGAKTLSFMPHVLWTHEARQRGFDEALLVGAGDALVEGASSNVFVVHEGRVRTPPLDAGALAGVTRAAVMAEGRRAGVDIAEARLTSADLWTADEVFVTSSVRELVPVVQIDDHVVGEGAPGTLTRRLHALFRAVTPAAGDPMPWA